LFGEDGVGGAEGAGWEGDVMMTTIMRHMRCVDESLSRRWSSFSIR